MYLLLKVSLACISASLLVMTGALLYWENSFFLEWGFYYSSSSEMVMGVYFDWMSVLFLSVVCFISCNILGYCIYYMSGEKNYSRFVLVLMFFVGSMCLLIISPNLVSILLGWDGLGLTSYILVIYYQNSSSCNAGLLTVLSNRIGDVAILVSVAFLSVNGGWNYIFYDGVSGLVVGLVVLAGMTKSAQVPFSAWLPAAMSAPTPVSALVHSSTLVTAGVYLLIRFNAYLMGSGGAYMLAWLGVLTMFMAGLGANFEGDLKKVVALSTLSQLGLMVVTLSAGLASLAFFHLITHALFKSTLFMCTGVFIHSISSGQDSRSMSSFGLAAPSLMLVVSASNLALCGFPFLAGFYSKDLIIEALLSMDGGWGLFGFLVVSTGMTVSYSLRLMFKSVNEVSYLNSVNGLGDLDWVVFKSVLGLVFFSATGGFIGAWWFLGECSGFVLSVSQKYSIMFVMLVSGVASYFIFSGGLRLILGSSLFSWFLSSMWFLPWLSTNMVSGVSLTIGGLASSFDQGWLEYYGASGIWRGSLGVSSSLQKGQSSWLVGSYLLGIFFIFWVFCF